MPQIIWSPAALLDLQRLYRFLAKENPPAAQRAIKAIRASVAILEQHAQIGRVIDSAHPLLRDWPVAFGEAGYIARYRLRESDIVILAIWQQREAGF